MRIVVTGGSGKGGAWVVRDLREHGHDVLNVDMRHDGSAARAVPGRRPDRSRPDPGRARRRRGGRPFRGDPGARAATRGRDLPDQHAVDLQRLRRRPSRTACGASSGRRARRSSGCRSTSRRRSRRSTRPSSRARSRPTRCRSSSARRWRRSSPGGAGSGSSGLRISNIMVPDDYAPFPSYWDDARIRKWNLWGYVDARDVASAARLALEAPIEGAEVCDRRRRATP